MDLDDWLLALHLIAAAALIGAMTLFWIVALAMRSTDVPAPTLSAGRVAAVGNATIIAGTAGTIVFGVWLALSLEGYEIWDGWIVASIVLWAVASGLGQRAGAEYGRGVTRARELVAAGHTGPDAELGALNRAPRPLGLHLASSIAVLAILVLMIWKPGA